MKPMKRMAAGTVKSVVQKKTTPERPAKSPLQEEAHRCETELKYDEELGCYRWSVRR